MTMDAMDSYLRQRGFTVDRKYIPNMKRYRFSLTKDGYTKNYFIQYPRSDADKMRELSYMIEDMRVCLEVKRMENTPCRLSGNLDDGYEYMPDRSNRTIELTIPKLDLGRFIKSVDTGDDFKKYCVTDATMINDLIKRRLNMDYVVGYVGIKDVIFNDPATIVFWTDGTKTVVKAVNEDFDKEKGLAMAISKKYFGNKGNYFNHIKKWVN